MPLFSGENDFLGLNDLGFLEDPSFGQLGLRGIFSSQAQNLGLPVGQQENVNQLFGPLYDQYLGFLTNQLRSGTTPTSGQTFDAFLGGGLDPGFPGLQNFFQSLSPQRRGLSDIQFAPRTRFI